MKRRLSFAVSGAGLGCIILVGLAGCAGSSPLSQSPPSKFAAEPQTAPPPSVAPHGSVVAVGDTPEGIVVYGGSDGKAGKAGAAIAVAALRDPDSLALVTVDSPHAVNRLAVPGRARHLRLAPNGLLLLPGEDVNKVFEIALPVGTVVAQFDTGRQPHDAVVAGGRVWVTDELAGTVTSLGSAGATLPAGLQPGGIAAAAGRVAAADVRGNKLYVFDAQRQHQIAVLPAGAGPTHVVQVGPNTVAVADTRGNAVLLYALDRTPRLLARISLPGGPYGMAADLVRHRLWVALSGRNQLVRLDVTATRLHEDGPRYATVQQPNSLAIDAATGEVVIAGATKWGTLQFLDNQ